MKNPFSFFFPGKFCFRIGFYHAIPYTDMRLDMVRVCAVDDVTFFASTMSACNFSGFGFELFRFRCLIEAMRWKPENPHEIREKEEAPYVVRTLGANFPG